MTTTQTIMRLKQELAAIRATTNVSVADIEIRLKSIERRLDKQAKDTDNLAKGRKPKIKAPSRPAIMEAAGAGQDP